MPPHAPTPSAPATGRRGRRRGQRGQVIVIFAGAMLALVALCAVVVDVAWYWTNNLRMQRAADAAALAGVVWLPGNVNQAYSVARAEAKKNGYDDADPAIVVVPLQDEDNPRRLRVTITAPVGTFFAKAVGINTWPAQRSAKADYVLPVPMGSPENYYGVFGMTRGLTLTEQQTQTIHTAGTKDSGFDVATSAPAGTWTASSGSTLVASVNASDSAYAQTNTNGAVEQWGSFGGFAPTLGSGESITGINGIEVELSNYRLSASCSSTTNRIRAALSWNGGASWTTTTTQTNSFTSTTGQNQTLGSASSLAAWGGHAWTTADLTNSNFRVRLTFIKGCGTSGTAVRLDRLRVRVTYATDTVTTQTTSVTNTLADKNLQGPGSACTTGVANCYEADGAALNPRGFWGTLNTQGAENINGDAFQPYYDTATSYVSPSCSSVSGDRACYEPVNYYNYGVEIPAGATNGAVYVYDPQFCQTGSVDKGTGDRWFGGSNAVSTFYELYDTHNTLVDPSDDTLVANSGTLFRRLDASDSSMGGTSGADECKAQKTAAYGDGRDYHNRWWLLASGLPGGTVYRLHTTSTDPNSAADQRSTNGENSFAVYASATGGNVRVYGLGAMQAFTPLKSTGTTVTSTFYLAQIGAEHAGKTVEIKLWDPGDTQDLQAVLKILVPTSGGWTSTAFNYSAVRGTANGDNSCASRSGSGVSSVTTNTGGTSLFNGCWLTISAVIPLNYTAPQDGWWKIQYDMTGNDSSFDVTTWTVNIRGNPVHLVLP